MCRGEGAVIPDLVGVAARVSAQRKGALADRDCLKQAFQGVALYCRRLLASRGALRHERRVSVDAGVGAGTPAPAPAPAQTQADPLMGLADLALGGDGKAHSRQRTTKQAGINFYFTDLCWGNQECSMYHFQEFGDPRAGIMHSREAHPDDPLSQLDPMWSLK